MSDGTQDSTLDGRFPSDFQQEGSFTRGEKISPQEVDTLSKSLNTASRGTADTSLLYGSTEWVAHPTSNVLAMNNTPVGGSLSGIYQFNATSGLFTTATKTASSTITTQTNTSINLGSVAITGGKAGRFAFQVGINPNTASVTTADVIASITNLSPTFFTSYPNLSRLGGFENFTNSLATGTTASFSFLGAPAPRYMYQYIQGPRTTPSTRGVANMPFIPNSSTTFTPVVSVSFNTGASLDITFVAHELVEPTPDATLQSSL